MVATPGAGPQRPAVKKIVVGLSLILLSAIVAFSLWTRDSRITPPVRAGHYWTGKTGDTWLIAYVTAEERGRRRALSSGRNPSYTTDQYYRYRLTVRTLPDGAVASDVLLGDVLRNQGRSAPEIVGVVGDVLWLWDGVLVARSLPDLVVRYTEEALRQAHPANADLIPREAKQFKVLASRPGLVMRGRDARFYLVDPANFALTPVAATDLPKSTFSTQPENWFDFITTPAMGRSMTSPYNQMTRILLTENGAWLGLLSDSELSGLANWVATENAPSGDVARALYRTTYTRDDRYAIIDPKAVQRMGDASFIQAGFILRDDWKPWHLREPDSALVLSKRRLGPTEPWAVTRLGHDGTRAWTTETGLVRPDEFLDVGPYLLVAGTPAGVSADVRERTVERVLWIDERTGAKTTLRVSSGEIVP